MIRRYSLLLLTGSLWFSAAPGVPAQVYTFGTLAGDPSVVDINKDPIGDYTDGTNSQARFNFPQAIAVDAAGDLYVADTLNNAIRRVARVGGEWVVTTVAGSGPTVTGSNDGTNAQAQFNFPQGVAVDSSGNLYVADLGNYAIRKITPAGDDWVVTTIAGAAESPGTNDGPGNVARFHMPASVAVDAANNVYVADYGQADYGANTIRKLQLVGTNWVVSTIAGAFRQVGSADGTNGQARFNGAGSLAADSAGRVYVSDWYNRTIRRIAPVGTNYVVTTLAGKAGSPDPLPVDGAGANARFSDALGGIGVDSSGNLYVTDSGMIRRITPLGTNWLVTTIAGACRQTGWADGSGTQVRFYLPQAVAGDGAGNVYVADSSNHAIRMGMPSTISPPPLRITWEGPQAILSWPLSALGFVLETKRDVLSERPWLPLTNGVAISGSGFLFTDNPGTHPVFYRLRLSQD